MWVSTVALALLSATSSLLMLTMQRSAMPRSLLRFALSCSIKRRYISHPSHDTSLQLHLCCCGRLATLCTITGLLKMTYRAHLSAFALITCWPSYFSMRWILSITFGFGDAALTSIAQSTVPRFHRRALPRSYSYFAVVDSSLASLPVYFFTCDCYDTTPVILVNDYWLFSSLFPTK
jgi:hypothetical protein